MKEKIMCQTHINRWFTNVESYLYIVFFSVENDGDVYFCICQVQNGVLGMFVKIDYFCHENDKKAIIFGSSAFPPLKILFDVLNLLEIT